MDAPEVVAPVVPVEPAAAPVGQVVDVETRVIETPAGETQDQNNEIDGTDGGKKPIQPRINELVRKRHEAEREAAYWRGVAETRAPKPATAESPAPAAAPAKPVVGDYQTYDEFVDALTDWKSDRAVEKALATVNAKTEERTTQQTAAQAEEARSKAWQTRQTATKEIFKDYEEVVGNSEVPIFPHVADLLKDSDHGPALAYKLAKDPALAEKLNKMTGLQAAKEFGRLEMGFETPATPAPPPVPLSKAPVPPTPVRVGAATSKDISKMSMDEYVAARKAAGANWGARG